MTRPRENPDAAPEGPAASKKAREDHARNVEVAFLEVVRARLPHFPAAIESLGCLYTEMGRFQDGLRADREMVKLEPLSPIAWYNLACSLALTEQPALALEALEKSVALGYADADWMEADADLVSLRDRPEFERILIKIRSAQAILPPPLF